MIRIKSAGTKTQSGYVSGVAQRKQSLHMLLVDDSVMLMDTIRRLLMLHERVEVVGAVTSGPEALALSQRVKPDVVLIGMHVRDQRGFMVARQIKTLPTPPRIILMTSFDAEAYRGFAIGRTIDGILDQADLGTMLLPLVNALLVD